MNKNIGTLFKEIYNEEPVIAKAPAVVNLLGDFADVNEGYCLPFAIDQYAYAAACRRKDDMLSLISVRHIERVAIRVKDIRLLSEGHWANDVLCVVEEIIKRGNGMHGFNMIVDGGNSTGPDLSSVLRCSVLCVLNEVFEFNISKLAATLISGSASNRVDQLTISISNYYASVFGKKGYALVLDSRKHWHEHVELKTDGYRFVMLDTGVKFNNLLSVCKERFIECEHGLIMIRKHFAAVKSLGEITLPMIEDYVEDEISKKRCIHVVKEGARVLGAVEDMKIGDLRAFGKKMFESNDSMQFNFGISCPELNWLVNNLKSKEGVLGAKMLPGNHPGCVILMIKESMIGKVWEELAEEYWQDMGKKLTAYMIASVEGSSIVKKPINASV